ncbi:phosphatidylserine decarboxylase [Rossellomorea marisflavi]|uniref:phosphatidylserine decarboxylase n=1 Tax=Rossellomorea marisflavi TaxID=189381 RepID=UPI00285257F5|nr:phosphatidylserine decarboxylase [Rossellomorea marisflavi]
MLKQSLYRLCIELTNKKWSSFLLRRFVRSKVSRKLIPSFAKTYRINTEEMEKSIELYPSLYEFFIRRLKPGARTIQAGEASVVSPVDGVMAETGVISNQLEVTVKGKLYSILDMLGSDEKAAPFMGGSFAVFYLSPANYHRIHCPASGEVIGRWELGNHSYPVNELGLRYGKETLSKNFRSITELRHPGGRMAVVKVGAMFVNSVDYVVDRNEWIQGEEVAYFSFGSTVILLFEKGRFSFDEDNTPREVRVGEHLGSFMSK